MVDFYASYPVVTGDSGGGVPTYVNFAAFPSAVTAGNGALAIALDTNILYESDGTNWLVLANPAYADAITDLTGDVSAAGPGSVPATVNSVGGSTAANVHSTVLEVAAATSANTVSTLVERDGSGNFSAGTISANLTGTASGNPPNARTIGTTAPLAGGGDLSANRTLSISQSSTSTDGYLSSTDWNTFNGKQGSGNYITALTGGVTATGPGSANATVVTNANLTGPITSTGNATSVAAQTGTGSTFVMQASPTLTTPNIGTPTAGVLTSCTGLPLTTGVTGTLPIGNGGTGQTSASGAFNALSPMTTQGDIIYGGTSGAGTRLVAGTSSQVLIGGTTPAWGNVPSAALPITTPSVYGAIRNYIPSQPVSVKTVSSANYVILDNDGFSIFLVTTGASDRTITLPTAANNAGREFSIKKVDNGAGAMIISGTIDGASSYTVTQQYAVLNLACDGTSYSVISTGRDLLSSQVIVSTNAGLSLQYFDMTSLVLTPGAWDIEAMVTWFRNSSTYLAPDFVFGVSSTSGNSSAGLTVGVNATEQNPNYSNTWNYVSQYFVGGRVQTTTNTTRYLKGYPGTYSVGTPQYTCILIGKRAG